jgi:hypothetical protein
VYAILPAKVGSGARTTDRGVVRLLLDADDTAGKTTAGVTSRQAQLVTTLAEVIHVCAEGESVCVSYRFVQPKRETELEHCKYSLSWTITERPMTECCKER